MYTVELDCGNVSHIPVSSVADEFDDVKVFLAGLLLRTGGLQEHAGCGGTLLFLLLLPLFGGLLSWFN